MVLEITPQTVITAVVILAAVILPKLVPFFKHFIEGVRWIDKQEQQSVDIKALEEKHDADMIELKKELSEDMRVVNEEQKILTYGILACLKGLREQGCNDSVPKAIKMIENHLNEKAHEV